MNENLEEYIDLLAFLLIKDVSGIIYQKMQSKIGCTIKRLSNLY